MIEDRDLLQQIRAGIADVPGRLAELSARRALPDAEVLAQDIHEWFRTGYWTADRLYKKIGPERMNQIAATIEAEADRLSADANAGDLMGVSLDVESGDLSIDVTPSAAARL
jgi:hypothetical protein